MIQDFLVLILLGSAVVWLGFRFYRTFFSKQKGCGSGCGACSSIDIDKIEKAIRAKEQNTSIQKS
jgi:hypothetical protein